MQWVVTATIVVVPCFISLHGRDVFREPKEYLLRASGALILILIGLTAVWDIDTLRAAVAQSKRELAIIAAACGWTAIVTATSLNRALSAWTLVYVCACALVFTGTLLTARSRGWIAAYALLAPAIVNGAALILQEARWWDIYRLDAPSFRSALVGNPNDVEAFFVVPALAAAAIAISRRAVRPANASIAAFLGAALLLTQSLAATIAYATGLFTMAALYSAKRVLIAVVAIVAALALAVAVDPPLRGRMQRVTDAIHTRDYNKLASYRLTAFAAAIQMFEERPVFGVGPGCYGWRYYDEKIRAEMKHPLLRMSADRVLNFGEAHNDHLQTLAVSGLPGYGILAGCLITLARKSRRHHESDDERIRFARTLAAPVAVASAVLMLAQFPLELAACTTVMVYAAALCAAWSST